ncbi:MAG TPA: LuxR C-terminal-related transcriptional regulator [Terriglobales bacterium]|nr:LuxR C-terminal-related transcriptional regulator [Terriglobales bacterium]
MQPRNRLTPREIEVAALVWEGMTNREIGQTIGTTEQVVKNYLRVIFDKLGVWSRLELALYIANHGGESWRQHVVLEAESRPRPAELKEAVGSR